MSPSESEAALGAEPDFPTAPSCLVAGISLWVISGCLGVWSNWVCLHSGWLCDLGKVSALILSFVKWGG